MLGTVTIMDDTLRRNRYQVVTPAMRLQALRDGKPIPPSTRFLLVLDRQGRKVQETVAVRRTYTGRHLELTLLRAKRWMRGRRFRLGGAPHHIAMAMAVFLKADPRGFREAVNVTAP